MLGRLSRLGTTQRRLRSALQVSSRKISGEMMHCSTRELVLVSLLAVLISSAAAQKIKVMVDQAARVPGTSGQQASLAFLPSDRFAVPAIPTVSGDRWLKGETEAG